MIFLIVSLFLRFFKIKPSQDAGILHYLRGPFVPLGWKNKPPPPPICQQAAVNVLNSPACKSKVINK